MHRSRHRCNKGIGLEIVRQLGQSGVTVLMGARNQKRGRLLPKSLPLARIKSSEALPRFEIGPEGKRCC